MTTKNVNRDNDQENRSIRNQVKQVFFGSNILFQIVLYLDFKQFVAIRRVNKKFNDELYFKFILVSSDDNENNCNKDTSGSIWDVRDINNRGKQYKFYLKYNNYNIKSMIESTVSPSVTNIVMWWLQVYNKNNGNGRPFGYLFGTKNKVTCTQEKNTEKRIYLCDLVFNDIETKYAREINQLKRRKFDNNNNYKLFEIVQPLNEISRQLNKLAVYRLIGQHMSDVKYENLDIEYLLLGAYYNIIPLISILKQALLNKDEFIKYIQYSCNKPQNITFTPNPVAIYGYGYGLLNNEFANHLRYLYQASLGSIFGCLVLGYKHCVKPRSDIMKMEGKLSLFAQLSLTGNFNYYKMFIDNVMTTGNENNAADQRRNKSYGMMLNGITTIFSLYLRTDLLKCVKYNNDYCYQMYNGFPFLMILFAANPSMINEFGKINQTKLGFNIESNNDSVDTSMKFEHQRRLYYLYNLCFSSKFLIELYKWCYVHKKNFNNVNSDDARQQFVIGRGIILQNMYNDCNEFVQKWQLTSFNKKKQKEIHNKYKLLIQMLLGLSDKFVYFDTSRNCNDWKILDGLKVIETNDCFVDIMPKCQDDVLAMYKILLEEGYHTEQEIVHELQYPVIDREEPTMEYSRMGGMHTALDAVSDLKKFLFDVWSLF